LKNQQSDLLQKKSLLISLNTVVGNLGSSIAALGSVAANRAIAASSSDPSTVAVTSTGASAPANYAITNISSLASAASGMSGVYANTNLANVSTAGAKTVQLVYGSTTKTITLTNTTNNLAGLVSAINSLGIGVNASILSPDATHNYLSLSASTSGQTTLRLSDIPADGLGNPDYNATPVNLLATTNNGTNASFSVNNIAFTRSTNSINDVIPGVNLNLLAITDSSKTVHVTLATDSSQLSNAIQTFVQNYNALQDSVNAQVGPAAGQLSGDSLINMLSQDMWQLGTYQGSGSSIKNLSDLGVTFDTSGKMSFDSNVFNSLSGSQISDAMKFFGSATSGFGALARQFTQLSDPTLGMILQQEKGYDQQNTDLTGQINNLTQRNAVRQSALNAKLQAADALVAQLQSQQSLLTASLQALNYSLYGYQNGPSSPTSSKNSTTG
jgi:flagellar hook-associated protein 2